VSPGCFDIFEAAAAHGEGLAVVCGDEEHTYAELAVQVAREQERLHMQGALRAPRVVMHGRPTVETMVRVLALLRYGVPMVMLHPRLSPAEQETVIQQSQPAMLLDAACEASPEPGPVPPPPAAIDPERIAAVFFTSGSSGTPKGAMLSRRAFAAACAAHTQNLGWTSSDRWLLCLPLAHIGGFSVLMRCLYARSCVVLAPDAGTPTLVRAIEQQRVTLVSLVPTQLQRLLRHAPSFAPPPWLRAVLVGGAAMTQSLKQQACQRGLPVLATYGLTEACAQVATEPPGRPAPAGSVGRALLPGSVVIKDGHILLRGPALMTGYLGAPALAPDALFDTQDLGALDDDGWLYVYGRGTDLVISGGENVHPQEVEDVLQTLPGIEAAVVFGRADPEWGQVVCAAVILSPGARIQAEAWTEALRSRLARFKHPRAWYEVQDFAQTRSNKVDRRAVAQVCLR